MMEPVSGRRITAAEVDRLVSELGERVDAAALAPEHWGDVLEGLQAIVSGPRVIMLATDDALVRPIVAASSGYLESDMRTFEQYYCGINPWNAFWPSNTSTPVFSDTVIPTRLLHESEFYCDWLKPVGDIDYATGVKLFDSDHRRALLSLNYGGARPAELHAILSPILSRLGLRLRGALLANRALAIGYPHRPDGPLMDSLLDPAFLLDENCRLIAANGAGEALIRQESLLQVGAGDAFRLRSGAEHRRLAKAVKALCRRGTGGAGDDFPLAGEGQTWTVSLLPVAQNSALAVKTTLALFMPRACALMVLRTAALPGSSAGGHIVLLPHLTPAERRLAQALLDGGSLVDIAARLGIAYGTARAQLKGIFAKTGAHNQRELITVLLRNARR